MSIEKSLQKLLNRKIELEKILSSGELSSGEVISFSTELSEITPVAEQANLVSKLKENLSETQTIINDQNNEKDFIDLAKDELDEIKETLNRYEPRISIQGLNCYPRTDENGYEVQLEYMILGREDRAIGIDIFLERTR